MRGSSGVLGWTVAAWALVAGAQPPSDLSGVYSTKTSQLAVLQGDNETLVYFGANFPQGQSVGTCDCSLVLEEKESAVSWALRDSDPEVSWTLQQKPKQLVLKSEGTAGCCGAGWPGVDTFSRATRAALKTCRVKVPRAYFHGSDAANTRRKAFVVEGDVVQAYVPEFEPDFVPARFVAKRTTVGLLKLEELDCSASAGASSTPPKGEAATPSEAPK